ncbi:MAG: type II secretion system F family protein [Azovibrio sp.]|uniref:type II secretion system F family protein n=1 Tax=Azovibrio sp. TaxID=1872673 RepID=UPI003C77E8C5
MPGYTYRGRDRSGQEVRGKLDAPSRDDAARSLMGMGVTPLQITEAVAAAGIGIRFAGFFEEKPKHDDVMLFCRQIYSLLKAGVPIMRALAGLQESAANLAMKKVLQDLRESLDSGRELSAAMARHPKVFSAFAVNMVRVGEMTGRLEEIFLRLFYHMEFERFMRDQVKSALRYPSFVIVAMSIAMVIINIWVIPAFAKVFDGFGAELPLMTRILIGFSDFMVNFWGYLLGGLVLAVLAFRSWVATRAGRYDWDRIKLRIPIAGKIVIKATLARFARSFALAAKSGVPVIQALSNVAQTVDNAYIADKIERMRDGVERGESVLRSAIATGIFTPVVIQMIAVGEESGSLDDMLQEVAEMYQREVEYELKTLSQQIEPILIVFLGIMVLILALGIFLPMWDLGKAVKGN